MNAKDIVILVCEKKAPAPYWSHTRGIYADLSEWPRHIDYYVKCPECLKPDTIIPGDYRPISDFSKNSLCIGTSGIQFVKQVMHRPYSGLFVTVNAPGLLPVECTPEHPILVCRSQPDNHQHISSFSEPEWKNASDLKIKQAKHPVGDYLVLPKLTGQFDGSSVSLKPYIKGHGLSIARGKEIPVEYPLTSKTAWLLGLYIAEGITTAKGVVFCLGKHESTLINKIINIAKSIGYSAFVAQKRTAITVEISSRLLSRMFADLCGKGASNKKIPECILLHTKLNLLNALLGGYMAGDGYTTKNVISAVTVSKILALQVQLAYARLGRFARIYEQTPTNRTSMIENRQVRVKNRFQIYITKKFKSKKGMRARVLENYILVPVRSTITSSYTGEVWNIETPDNTYLVSNAVVHNCGSVHGFYKSFADARSKRLCPNCDYEHVEKLKKEITKVTEDEQPPVPFDPDIPVNPKAEINRYIGADWIDLAKWELSKELGEELAFDLEHYANNDVDPEFPDNYTKVVFKAVDSGINYIVYKNESDARIAALEVLKNRFEDEPDVYSEWLKNFINTDKLRETLMPDEENMMREQFDEEHSDYEDKARAMVEAGKLDEDSFFKINGEFRKLTPQRERLIDMAVDKWVEETAQDRLSDPVEYMKELGWGERTETDRYTGRKIPSLFEQIKDWGALDYEKAAERSIATDG